LKKNILTNWNKLKSEIINENKIDNEDKLKTIEELKNDFHEREILLKKT
jgi:hypothetical protein